MTTAEQFLAQQGIKFRVVQAKRGPGEWNVTFSRKGGGRLKVNVTANGIPDLLEILHEVWCHEPGRGGYMLNDPEYAADFKQEILSYKKASQFFTPNELTILDEIDEDAYPL
jgi:hypothetical protein